MSDRRKVLIFRQKLLLYSETFILSQASLLRDFTPHYVGISRVPGLTLPEGAASVMSGRKAGAALFKLTGLAPRFIAKLRSLRPALIHAHFEDGGIFALPLAQALGIPLVTTFHGYDATMHDAVRTPNPLARAIYLNGRRALMKNGTAFIAVSDFIKQKMIERGYPKDRIVRHYIGVDTAKFSPCEAGAAGRQVLFVGRMVEKKGCEYLIRAMIPVLEKRTDARLVLIGDGPQKSALQALASAARPDQIVFLGAVDSTRIRQELSQSAVLAAPSVTAASGDSEGLPIAVCEAQAMGVPVAGFHHAGIPEIVKHSVTGLLFPERSVEGLQAGLERLLDDTGLRNRFGAAARERVRACFSLSNQTASLEAIYNDALSYCRKPHSKIVSHDYEFQPST